MTLFIFTSMPGLFAVTIVKLEMFARFSFETNELSLILMSLGDPSRSKPNVSFPSLNSNQLNSFVCLSTTPILKASFVLTVNCADINKGSLPVVSVGA